MGAVGVHRIITRWSVRDASHFRVDIDTLLPAIEAGTETVVVRGQRIYRYDTRTGTAAVGTLYPFARKSFGPAVLPILRTGDTYGQAPEPDPSQSIQHYLAQQESERAKVHGYARVVGHSTLLGRKVDIVQFAPLILFCSDPGRNMTCKVPMKSYGVGKAWIDAAHPFVLQYREYFSGGVHNLHTERTGFVYRVTSIHYGSAPSAAQLAFHPPVPVRDSGHWTIGSSAGTDLPHNGSFIVAPSPARFAPLDWLQPAGASGGEEVGPLPVVTRTSMLYSVRGRHVITYQNRGDRYGSGLYVVGPFLYVQERIQVHGLPQALRRGTLTVKGVYRFWSVTGPHGVRQVAFQHGRTSVQVVTNALSTSDLLRYAYEELASSRW